IGPNYTAAPELTVKDGVPKGKIERFTMRSEDSKFYPGIAQGVIKQRYDRAVAVYIPAQYVAGTGAPFMVIHDGPGYVNNMTRALDNLIAEKRVPAMIAVFLNHGGGDSLGSERGLEYDQMSGKFSDFIEAEVLPKIVADYKVKFTD